MGAERDHPAEASLISLPVRRSRLAGSLTASVALAIAGCGPSEDGEGTEAAGLPAAGGGGKLAYAVSGLPDTLDPLAAATASERLVIRQLYEPLTENLHGPYGSGGRQPALALSVRPSADRRVWTLALRPGVRFQDGSPFNASAVLANSRRWRSSVVGRTLLPELFAVDAPRPGEVRFLLDSPAGDLPARLRDPRLAIVSPQALEPRSGEQARFVASAEGAGTGPFGLAAGGPGELALTRSARWWGSDRGLGPALDSVLFRPVRSDRARVKQLRSGRAQAAAPFGPGALRLIAADPLLTTVAARDGGIGLEASVRGIDRLVQPLSEVWLTTVTG